MTYTCTKGILAPLVHWVPLVMSKLLPYLVERHTHTCTLRCTKQKLYLLQSYKDVMAGGRAYALGMKPYLRVFGAYAHNQPSTV